MSSERNAVLAAIDRWEREALIDAKTAEMLRVEATEIAALSTQRFSQYVLAATGAIVLVIAGGVFLDWAWPLLQEGGRSITLAVIGIGVVMFAVRLEASRRWLPASYLMQAAGLGLLIAALVYSKEAWDDMTLQGYLTGGFALAIPLVMIPRAIQRNIVMPAVHLGFGFGFLALALDRATPLSIDGIIWVLDGSLAVIAVGLARALLRDPTGVRHPWALNAFVMALLGGFVLVSMTGIEPLALGADALIPVDVWLWMIVGLTLWGLHRGPAHLPRAGLDSMLAGMMVLWIPLGFGTALGTFEGGPELALSFVTGVGVAGFVYATRFPSPQLLGGSALAFIVGVWYWAVERAGALGAVIALAVTAAVLFWISGRAGRSDGKAAPEASAGVGSDDEAG